MDVTLDQAKAFEAVARTGTIQKAAAELHKGHSAVVYLLRALEDQCRLKLFDRSGYRNKITLEGEIVLRFCRQLLETRRELAHACSNLQGGWEPSLKLIYDGIVDFNFIGDALFRLNEMKAPTEVKVLAAHLSEVEALFATETADMMVTILPIHEANISSIKLKPIVLRLVAHRDHPLGNPRRGEISKQGLNEHTYIRIKTSSGQVGLSTEQMKFDSCFFVNDFTTKKMAIMKNLGFGWLPDYLIETELRKKELRVLKTDLDNTHTVYPALYHRSEKHLGKAATELLGFFRKT